MAPVVAALIAAGVAAGVSAGGSAAAGAGSGNTRAIKRLKLAQATGRLTAADQAAADIGSEQEAQATRDVMAQQSAALAQQGATSARDVALIGQVQQKAEADLQTRAADRIRAAYAGEAQELSDRKALRTQNRREAVGSALKAGAAAAYTAGTKQGFTAKGKNPQPVDYGVISKKYGDAVGQAVKGSVDDYYAGNVDTKTFEDALRGLGLPDDKIQQILASKQGVDLQPSTPTVVQ